MEMARSAGQNPPRRICSTFRRVEVVRPDQTATKRQRMENCLVTIRTQNPLSLNGPCRFESGHRHPLNMVFTRENRSKLPVQSIAQCRTAKRTDSPPICQLFVNSRTRTAYLPYLRTLLGLFGAPVFFRAAQRAFIRSESFFRPAAVS